MCIQFNMHLATIDVDILSASVLYTHTKKAHTHTHTHQIERDRERHREKMCGNERRKAKNIRWRKKNTTTTTIQKLSADRVFPTVAIVVIHVDDPFFVAHCVYIRRYIYL